MLRTSSEISNNREECNVKKSYLISGWCILSAFFVLIICSRSSFLYPCNDWNDANSFFTVGKAFINGQVPYRDLFEQKGPYLYLIYGISYLLSHNSFFGVFILEVVSLAIFLYFAYQIMVLYCKEKTALVFIPTLAFCLMVSKSFYWGGAAEEFCLPFMCISLYDSMLYLKENYPRKPSVKMIIKNGIFAGIISLIKYTLLGFYAAWIGVIMFAFFVKKRYKIAIYDAFIFLGGMLIAFLPCFFYFMLHGALYDWYQCYVYVNVFCYSNLGDSINLAERVYELAKILYWLILDNRSYFLPIIIGMIYILFSRRIRWYEKLNVYTLFALLFLGIYIGGSNLPYYSIPLMIFAVIGIAAIGRFIDRYIPNLLKKKGIRALLMSVSITTSILGSYHFSMNSFFLSYEREDFFLFRFQKIVEQEQNPTLLTYNCLDAGLYTIADIMPTCRFFHRCNLDYEEMEKEQFQYLEQGKTQFVLAADSYPDIIMEKYDLVAQEVYEQVGTELIRTYYLFRKKGD